MMSKTNKGLAAVLMVAILAPSLLFAIPSRAHAIPVSVKADFSATSLYILAKETISAVKSVVTAAATYAQMINDYVLQPLAFVMSIGLMKSITAGVLAFVVGKSNGNGKPQFVQNLQGNLQKVGDVQALAFFAQFGSNSNSPFALSIKSRLRTTYFQQTSLAGFFAANQCTLFKASPNINSFLAGNWSQGGAKAWLSLTTVPQNNPYTLSQKAETQLGSLVGKAQETRNKILEWGQGFLAWCGSSGTADEIAAQAEVASNSLATANALGDSTLASSVVANSSDTARLDPGEPCTKKDGTPGIAQTPGTTIKATLDKVLGGTQDKLVQMGSLAKEVNSILGSIGTIMQTVDLAKAILGGRGSGGLAGFAVAGVGGSSTSQLTNYQNSTAFGVSTSTVYENATSTQTGVHEAFKTQVDEYEKMWETIRTSAQDARNSLLTLGNSCQSMQGSAQTAIENAVNPVMARVDSAIRVVADARTALSTAEQATGEAAVAAGQRLNSMPPTADDLSNVQEQVIDQNDAIASPTGSLNVSGGTIMSRMVLLKANTESILSACAQNSSGGGG